MKQLQKYTEAHGKTVKEIRFAGNDDELMAIIFDDDSVLVIEAQMECDHETAHCWHEVRTLPVKSEDAHRFGLLSVEEYARIRAEEKRAEEERQRERDMVVLRLLKQKYPEGFE